MWLLAASAVAMALRLHCLWYRYLWLDEFVTLWSIGGGGYGAMLDRALHWTASGPLFALSYRLSCDVLGDLVWGLKVPSLICGILAVWTAWWATRWLFLRDDVALAAAWFVAVDPQFVAFSQDGRPYMPAVLLSIAAIGCLACWLRTGRLAALAGAGALASVAVGFHLIAALGLVSQNAAVLLWGLRNKWPWRRWIAWAASQCLVACSLGVVGAQFWMLSDRHGSMIFETSLAMPTRHNLDDFLACELQTERIVLLTSAVIWLCARRFPRNGVADAVGPHLVPLCLAAGNYLVPSVLLTLLSKGRIVDSWPRYYFLFYPGMLVALAWVLTRPFPRPLSRAFVLAVLVGMFTQYRFVDGLPTCRVEHVGWDWDDAEAELRRRVGPGDLVLSRGGLIEANQIAFLQHPHGSSYLRCFLESRNGPLAAEHLPLPFSPESDATRDYIERLTRERLWDRSDFWLVNVGPGDFDYRVWLDERLGSRFENVEERRYSALVLCHYVRVATAEIKGTSDRVTATSSKAPCQRSTEYRGL
jgi:hypothetical protein